MRVVVVEDDSLQAESIAEALQRSFRDLRTELISTECEFRARVDALRSDPPDVFLMDVMLRWTDPTPDRLPPPTDVEQEGFFRGGLRCLQMILDAPEMNKIPVVVYSVLDREDVAREISAMPRHVLFLRKDSDERRLVMEIRSLLQGLPEVGAEGWQRRLWESMEAKPGWFGFSLDLKRLLNRSSKARNR